MGRDAAGGHDVIQDGHHIAFSPKLETESKNGEIEFVLR